MASMRNIKRRIKSVSSTQQITKAMNLVSASKLQKAKTNLAATRPFFQETQRVIASIVTVSGGLKHKYLTKRDEVKNIGVILLSADRGLCGGYNSNVSKEAFALIQKKNEQGARESVIVSGNKGRDFLKRRGKNIIKNYTGISEAPTYQNAKEMGELAVAMYERGEIDEIHLVYTEFKSTLVHNPKAIQLLPISADSLMDLSKEQTAEEKANLALMNYEPAEDEVLNYIVPKYINTVIFGALVESAACEEGARMTSMDTATENAEEMIDKLTLSFNRARQGAITQEITEIISGANALS